MAHDFASQEWADAYWQELRTNEEFRRAAATWVFGPLTLYMIPSDEGIEEPVELRTWIHEGDTRSFAAGAPDGDHKTPYVFTGTYETFRKIFAGDVNLFDEVLAGRIRHTGDLPSVKLHETMFTLFFAAATAIGTTWPEDVAAAETVDA